ncbi:MAG: FAD-binding protein [Aestuariivirga sp.]
MKPRDVVQLSEAIRSGTSPFELIGRGTKRALGRPIKATQLDLSAFNKIVAYEPEELILECGAAMKLTDVQKLLKKHNQMLAFEPPDYSTLLGSEHSGSIGGALMCNLSGPRRPKAGAARDHILGVSGVNGSGEIIKAGARVVKNVTGYDVPRLVAGSYGTLMALTSVIFKVLPAPETEETLHIKCKDLPQAISLMALALQTRADVSAAAFVPGQGFYLRLEGIAPSVAFRRDVLLKAIVVKHEILSDPASRLLWASLRDAAPMHKHKNKHIWRVSIPPMDAPRFLASLGDVKYFCDWAGGLIWIAAEPGTDIRKHMTQGHAMLFRADAKTRERQEVFQPQPPELTALSARVKNAFDPKGLFNPGRMYKAI